MGTKQAETYTKELEEMQRVTKEEYLASLRRQSSGFSRGVSKYRGVARFLFFSSFLFYIIYFNLGIFKTKMRNIFFSFFRIYE